MYYNNKQQEVDLHEVAGLLLMPDGDGGAEWQGTEKEWEKYRELVLEEETVF